MRRMTIAIITAVVLILLFIVLCTFVKRPYEKVLLSRFGTLIPESGQARIMYNWYFKLPTDTVIPIDTRLHLNPGKMQEVATSGKETISVRAFAVWRIVDTVKFYKTLNADDGKATSTLDSKITGLVQAQLSRHSLDELFNVDEKKVHTVDIEDEIARQATEGSTDGKSSGMRDMGIEVAEVGFSRMAFPPQNAEFVYERMVEELKQQATNFSAQGEAQAKTIRAQGQQEAERIRQEAIAKAGDIRGKAAQVSLRIIADAQSSPEDRAFYQWWKSLDFLKASMTKNTIFVLPTNTPWLEGIMEPPSQVSMTQPAARALAPENLIPPIRAPAGK